MARFDHGYTRLDKEILYSSVWVGTDTDTKVLWITLLALASWSGYVGASLPGLAVAAGIRPERCAEIMAMFEGPDPESRDDQFEGRRVEKVERGWQILNYEAFRDAQTPVQAAAAARKRMSRARQRAEGSEYETDG